MQQTKQLPTYLSIDGAAKVMSVSTNTIRRRISDGTIPAYHCGRRHIVIRLDDLEGALRLPARRPRVGVCPPKRRQGMHDTPHLTSGYAADSSVNR